MKKPRTNSRSVPKRKAIVGDGKEGGGGGVWFIYRDATPHGFICFFVSCFRFGHSKKMDDKRTFLGGEGSEKNCLPVRQTKYFVPTVARMGQGTRSVKVGDIQAVIYSFCSWSSSCFSKLGEGLRTKRASEPCVFRWPQRPGEGRRVSSVFQS